MKITKEFMKQILNAKESYKSKRRKVMLIKEKINRLINVQQQEIEDLIYKHQRDLARKTKELEELKRWGRPCTDTNQDDEFKEYGYFLWWWDFIVKDIEFKENFKMDRPEHNQPDNAANNDGHQTENTDEVPSI